MFDFNLFCFYFQNIVFIYNEFSYLFRATSNFFPTYNDDIQAAAGKNYSSDCREKLALGDQHYWCVGSHSICSPLDEYVKAGKPNDGTLCKLLNEYGSDKCTRHNYGAFYDFFFKRLRMEHLKVLEFGLGPLSPRFQDPNRSYTIGASQRSWREYFPNSVIFGADIRKNGLFQQQRLKTFYADITKSDTLKTLFDSIGSPLDILVDDSWHSADAQKTLFSVAYPQMKPGGLYMVEDITAEVCGELLTSYSKLSSDIAFIHIYNSGDTISLIRKPTSNSI